MGVSPRTRGKACWISHSYHQIEWSGISSVSGRFRYHGGHVRCHVCARCVPVADARARAPRAAAPIAYPIVEVRRSKPKVSRSQHTKRQADAFPRDQMGGVEDAQGRRRTTIGVEDAQGVRKPDVSLAECTPSTASRTSARSWFFA